MKYLTDVDGVLLYWVPAFKNYVAKYHGIVFDEAFNDNYSLHVGLKITPEHCLKLLMEFNRSSWIGNLSPFEDAVKYIRKLFEERGIRWTVITALGSDHNAQKLRVQNLEMIFGKDIFEEIIFTNSGPEKLPYLKEFSKEDCVWVEDHPDNAEIGRNLGMKTFLINQTYNIDESVHSDIIRVNNWKHISGCL